MSLQPGTRFGPYEVISLLGQGGMGQVYRARDTKLDRDVALKILPDSFASDPDRLMRFTREAKTLASLNHANIAAIYGIEDRALVMELVEGDDLSVLVARGALALRDALPIARQAAEALEAAHEAGIVHRDLKPANIKVRADGTVKVLDFGLAKAMEPNVGRGFSRADDGASEGTPYVPQESPTMTSPAMTQMGMILGTAAYMSPEQARGRAVNARTDIWAFGCVLFEMLSGRPPFEGESVTDILGAIVHKDPDWNLLPATLPESLRHLLERCLAKDQKQRLHSIADVRLEIQDLLTRPRSTGPRAAVVPDRARMTTRERTAWGLAALSVIAAGTVMALPRSGASTAGNDRAALRLSMLPSEGGEVGVPAISPDGRRVAYSARRADGMPMVWVRDLDSSVPKALAGTEGGNRVFWSPDSKRLGFIIGKTLKQISADGGPVREIVRNAKSGASWGTNDAIVYADSSGHISRVDASGGQTVPVTTIQAPDWEHVSPSMLPDGRHFLFTAKHWTGLAEAGSQGIYLGSIDNASGLRQLLPELSSAVYAAPGYVVFAREGQLMAAPFSVSDGRITGEPAALGETVAIDGTYYIAGVSAASDGTLAIRLPPTPVLSTAVAAGGTFDAELTLLRRDGSVASHFGGVQQFGFMMSLSPDARTVVAAVQDARSSASDLWRFDVVTGTRTPVTTMRTSGGWTGSPIWSSDSTRLAYACQLPGILDDVCVRDMRTGGVTTVIQSKTIWEHPRDWSFDGQYMLVAYDEYTASSKEELRVWSARTNTLSPYLQLAQDGKFSPDAGFVAFTSFETGREEVLVTTFPQRQQTWPLTTDGGNVLSWSKDGKEILVATFAGHIVAYPVTLSGGAFSAGAPQVLVRNVGFDARFARASRDHSRILVRVPKDAAKDHGEIRLLFGWAKGLSGR